MPAPGPLSEKLKNFSLRDTRTQLGLASVFAILVLILAFVALPGGKKTATKTTNNTLNGSSPLPGDTGTINSGGGGSGGGGPLGGAGGSSTGGGGSSGIGNVDTTKIPPLTANTIKVGFTYNEDPGTANAAAGFGSVGQIDQRRGWDAMIKLINQHPPLGRKIVPVYYHQTTSQIQSKGVERIEQEACSYFTKDNKVFMVFDGFLLGAGTTFHSCATKHHIPEIGGSVAPTAQTFKTYPYLVSPTDSAFDRMARFEVDQLYAQHFFSGFKNNVPPYSPQKPVDGKAKIGLIRYDTQGHKAAAKTMKDALAKHGLALCNGCEFEISYSASDVNKQLDDATEVNSAIANAKAKGITHMLFLGSTAGVRITLFYVDGAEKQQYRARLGFNPQDAPNAVRDFQGTTSDSYEQFKDSIVVSDGPAEFSQQTDAFKACKKIFEAAGETFTGSEAANKEGQIPVWCDDAWYYQSAMAAVPGHILTSDSFMQGVANAVPVPSAAVYLMQTKADRHDGSGAVRDGNWFDSCKCFKPVTSIIPV